MVRFGHFLQQDVTDIVIDVGPCINHLVITLVVGDESHVIVVHNLANFLVSFLYQALLLWRDDDVVKVERKSGEISHAIAEVLDSVEELAGTGKTDRLDDIGNDVAQTLLRNNGIHIAHFIGNDSVNNHATD